jgi:hypothetical protein
MTGCAAERGLDEHAVCNRHEPVGTRPRPAAWENRLAECIRQAHEARRICDTETLANNLQQLDADVQHVITRGKKSGNDRLIMAGIEAAGRNRR